MRARAPTALGPPDTHTIPQSRYSWATDSYGGMLRAPDKTLIPWACHAPLAASAYQRPHRSIRTGAFAPAAENARSCRAGRKIQVAAKRTADRWHAGYGMYRLVLVENGEKIHDRFPRVMASASLSFQTLSGRIIRLWISSQQLQLSVSPVAVIRVRKWREVRTDSAAPSRSLPSHTIITQRA